MESMQARRRDPMLDCVLTEPHLQELLPSDYTVLAPCQIVNSQIPPRLPLLLSPRP